ncbi:MAG: alcohol dehydrogenase catalytic domain-containing protein, partial [Stackebrandtia sp.]
MHAVRQYEFGPAENLRYETVDDPAPGPGQVRIAVKASGVHLIETYLRGGTPVGPHPLPQLPMTPGGEVAGVVDAVGPGADESLLGKRVVASLTGTGGYAELAVTEGSALHVLPDELDFPAAVAMVTTGTTAMAVLEVAELTGEDVVLVTAAAGGIGALLVQAAHRKGATVVAAAGGAAKVVRAAELGANLAIDYKMDNWAGTVADKLDGRKVTVVLDGV